MKECTEKVCSSVGRSVGFCCRLGACISQDKRYTSTWWGYQGLLKFKAGVAAGCLSGEALLSTATSSLPVLSGL